MDGIPISGLSELQSHLQELESDASVPFNAKLFDDVELQLTGTSSCFSPCPTSHTNSPPEETIPPLLPLLLPSLTSILKTTTQDPTPLLTLTIKLLSPLTFTRTLTIADPPSLLTALRSPLPGANLLALAILHKAAKSPSDAAILSTLPEVVEELVRTWLVSEDTGVGERAGRVLGDLLDVDCDVVNTTEGGDINPFAPPTSAVIKRRLPGHARLWRLILTRPFLTQLTTLCTPSSSRTTNQTTISQGRLLRLLPRLATLNIHALSQSSNSDIFPLSDAAAEGAGRGLLQWAALGMVDAEDVLMHLNLVDFFETLVSVMRVTGRSIPKDAKVRSLVRTAVRGDGELEAALRSLPDRTVEEEAEALRAYISQLLD